MESVDIKFAPLGLVEYQYSIIPRRNDKYLIMIDGVEVCSIRMKKDGTELWETCGDAGLTDEEIDFLATEIKRVFM